MRTVSTLLVLVVLVAGVAIRGSMARPIADPGAMVLRCQAEARGSVECRPLEGPLSVMVEEGPGLDVGGDYGALAAVDGATAGDAYGDPDRISARAVLAFARDVFDFALRAYDFATHFGIIGGMLFAPPLAVDRLFDPQ
ncbi:MAG: hypothetical protein QN157_10915 [Armatimonadota bacterium]|nr:hypothetical protein [Armatimonadota bacterium]